jgi:hypothetical protein
MYRYFDKLVKLVKLIFSFDVDEIESNEFLEKNIKTLERLKTRRNNIEKIFKDVDTSVKIFLNNLSEDIPHYKYTYPVHPDISIHDYVKIANSKIINYKNNATTKSNHNNWIFFAQR